MKGKLRISSILFSVVYWIVVAFYLVIVRYFGQGKYTPPDLHYSDVAAYAGIVGFFLGLLFGVFPLNAILGLKRRRSFLHVVLIGTSCYILFFACVIFTTSIFGNTIQFAFSYLFSPEGLIILFHLSVCSLIYHFILQINKKFGPGILLEYAFGKYFAPKVEERAFMFLDLKSSTRIAETLEHVAYSRLIQDCYAELTRPLLDHRAHVYQYVGDEVVVSWNVDRAFSGSLCHQFFYSFQERLTSRKQYFLDTYKVVPEFKAGAHCGSVTVAEVGEIKTEIAYHGDVLNTASRIQNLCNPFDKQLLISESLFLLFPDKERRVATFVGEVELRGKEAKTKIYSLIKSTQ